MLLLESARCTVRSRNWVPIGFFFANGTFLLLSWLLTDQQFMEWGWRVPFILSAALVLIGLYVRVSLHETPVFAKVAKAGKQVKIPLGTLLSKHWKATYSVPSSCWRPIPCST
ncbi:Inner membrane metabolite transport protein YhjE [Serratia plymuthica]|nr:Inner membrane metabolite transport protein YhjE [Serratia plymuthica]